MDDNGDWTLGTTAFHFETGTVFGISPTAGTQTMAFSNAFPETSGTNFIVFSELLAQGLHTVSLDVGNYNNIPTFATLGDIGLTVGGSQPTTAGTLLTVTSSSEPTPASGAIETWTHSYDITASNPNIGSPIGFAITVPFTGVDRNVSFDNLRIDFVPAAATVIPEPSSLALLGIGAIGLFGDGWRRKRKQSA
jgi:hypothetical protein